MRFAILSDIHANLEALEAVLQALAGEDIDQYLCLGDIVGYAADPAECIVRIQRLNPIIIAGNHDWASVGLFDVNYFNPAAQEAVLWTSRNLSSQEKEFLKNLELVYQQGELTLVHGSLSNPEKFEYIQDLASAQKCFGLLASRICFIGHSHKPIVFIKEDQHCQYAFKSKIRIDDAQSYIVNAGSVGQPRDGNPQACYAVYDNQNRQVQINSVSYDIRKCQDKIIKAGLPKIFAERLAFGR